MIHTAQDLLACLLAEGACQLGEAIITSTDAFYLIVHQKDSGLVGDQAEEQLKVYKKPQEAREIARYSDEGEYRPLKTAPTLRRGWLLKLSSLEELTLALEFLYPAALELYYSFLKNQLKTTPLRQTLDRQTGMYRITQLLKENQARELMEKYCHQGCLRQVMWRLGGASGQDSPKTSETSRDSWTNQPVEDLPLERQSLSAEISLQKPFLIPIICREACNLLVAKARPLARKNLSLKK